MSPSARIPVNALTSALSRGARSDDDDTETSTSHLAQSGRTGAGVQRRCGVTVDHEDRHVASCEPVVLTNVIGVTTTQIDYSEATPASASTTSTTSR